MLLIIPLVLLTLTVASLCDLKSGEIPDTLSMGFTAAVLLISVGYSLERGSFSHVSETLMIGLIYFLVGYVIFKLGQWGGGDVKLLAGIGCALGLLNSLNVGWPNSDFFHYTLTYYVNIASVATPYVLIYALFLGFKNPESFSRFKDNLKRKRTMLALSLSFIPFMLTVMMEFGLFALFYLTIPALYLLSVYLKAVEVVALQKNIPTLDLKEGDVLAHDLVVGDEKIFNKHNIEGLSREQVDRIKEFAKNGKIPDEVRIKWGVKFVPIFLFAFMITLWVGNLLELFFKFIPAP